MSNLVRLEVAGVPLLLRAPVSPNPQTPLVLWKMWQTVPPLVVTNRKKACVATPN
jgi:hypothetical protein